MLSFVTILFYPLFSNAWKVHLPHATSQKETEKKNKIYDRGTTEVQRPPGKRC